MPSFTPANALLRAADNLTAAINGAMPRITVTKDAVDQLLKIFKIQAMATNNEVNQQRQRQTNAHTQRVRNKAMEEPDESWMDLIKSQEEEENITLPGPQRVTTATSLPIVEFKEVTNHQTNLHTHTPMITQDSTSNTPAYNTQQQRITRTLTQDIACQIIKVKLDMSQVAGRQYPLQYLCNWASAVLDNKTGNLLEYWHLLKHPKYKEVWSKSFGTKMQRLITTSKTIFSIKKGDIPEDWRCNIIYGQICCNYHSKKKDPYQTRITMGGNLINYPSNCRTPTADILTVKTLFNSIVSTPNAKFMTINIKGFYLMTPMSCYEYFWMKLELTP
jgi:hypothetical protein